MRSSSEVKWARVRNNVGQRTAISDWHAIIPGYGSLDVPPGTVCGVGLTGALQMVGDTAIKTLDGRQHDECVQLVRDWMAELDPSPGLLRNADPEVIYARPGSTSDGG